MSLPPTPPIWVLSLSTAPPRLILQWCWALPPSQGSVTSHCAWGPPLFSHSPAGGRLGCFPPLAAVSNADVNVSVQIPPGDPAFQSFGHTPGSRIAGSHGNSFVIFLRNHSAVFHRSCIILHPHMTISENLSPVVPSSLSSSHSGLPVGTVPPPTRPSTLSCSPSRRARDLTSHRHRPLTALCPLEWQPCTFHFSLGTSHTCRQVTRALVCLFVVSLLCADELALLCSPLPLQHLAHSRCL